MTRRRTMTIEPADAGLPSFEVWTAQMEADARKVDAELARLLSEPVVMPEPDPEEWDRWIRQSERESAECLARLAAEPPFTVPFPDFDVTDMTAIDGNQYEKDAQRGRMPDPPPHTGPWRPPPGHTLNAAAVFIAGKRCRPRPPTIETIEAAAKALGVPVFVRATRRTVAELEKATRKLGLESVQPQIHERQRP